MFHNYKSWHRKILPICAITTSRMYGFYSDHTKYSLKTESLRYWVTFFLFETGVQDKLLVIRDMAFTKILYSTLEKPPTGEFQNNSKCVKHIRGETVTLWLYIKKNSFFKSLFDSEPIIYNFFMYCLWMLWHQKGFWEYFYEIWTS